MKSQPYSCGLGPALDVIGGKWKSLILWEVHSQPVRFGELKRRVPGISEKMLIQQLREMEADGIVHREVYHEVPPRVEYSVTEFGASLNEALAPLAEWGQKHMARIGAAHRPEWAAHQQAAAEHAECAQAVASNSH
jgi:DNA-binding HxlR family transcriptional regulator